MELEKAFGALGLAAEFTPAAAIYLIFLLLDRKSSDQAREAISTWTRGEQYRGRALQAPMVALFDRIYSYPLFSFKAFARSVLITAAIYIAWRIWIDVWLRPPLVKLSIKDNVKMYAPLFAGNALSDYLSLFAIRAILKVAANHLLSSLALAAISGVLIVLTFFDFFFELGINILIARLTGDMTVMWRNFSLVPNYLNLEHLYLIAPALFVHFWLPLFAIGIIGLRLLQALRYALGKAQWFLREGTNHPIEAAGLVAAVLVFIGTGLFHFARWELS